MDQEKTDQLIEIGEDLLAQAEAIGSVKEAEVFLQSIYLTTIEAQFNNIEPCNSYLIEGGAIRLAGEGGISNKHSFSLNSVSNVMKNLSYKENETSLPHVNSFPQIKRSKKIVKEYADDRIIEADDDDYLDLIKEIIDIHTVSYLSTASAKLSGIIELRVIINTGSEPVCEISTWLDGRFRVDLQATYNLISVQREFSLRTWEIPLSEVKSEVVARAMIHSERNRSLRTRDFHLPIIFSPEAFTDIIAAYLRATTLMSGDYLEKKLRIREPLTIFDDPTISTGKNSFVHDDEGTFTQKTCIIADGEPINPLSRVGVNEIDKLTGNGFRIDLENPFRRLFHHNIHVHPRNIVVNSPNTLDSMFVVPQAIFIKRLSDVPYVNHFTGEFILTAGEGIEIRNEELTSYIAPFQIKGNLFSLLANEFELGGKTEQHYSKHEKVNIYTPAFITNNCKIGHH